MLATGLNTSPVDAASMSDRENNDLPLLVVPAVAVVTLGKMHGSSIKFHASGL